MPEAVPRTRVAVIGMGRMGSAIARQLAPHADVSGWDVRPDALDGVRRTVDPATMAREADVILACLPGPKETAGVVLEPAFLTAFRSSSAHLADCSTSDPASIVALADAVGAAGERIVDAPILGRPDRCGHWTMPIGGHEAAFDAVAPVLAHVAARVEHVGRLGSGHTIKLLNNMMFAAINVVAAEAVGACSHLGIDPRRFADLIIHSGAATVSPLFRDLAPRMVGETSGVVFTNALLHKDLTLAVSMCRDAGVPLALGDALAGVTRRGLDAGLAEDDTAALVRLFAKA